MSDYDTEELDSVESLLREIAHLKNTLDHHEAYIRTLEAENERMAHRLLR